MMRSVVLAAAAALIGFVVALGVKMKPNTSAVSDSFSGRVLPAERATDETQIARIEKTLKIEQMRREALATEVQRLREEVLEIASRAESKGERPTEDGVAEAEEPGPTRSPARDGTASFDSEAIITAGFDPARVEEFRLRLDQIELDRLYLRDQAAREGWLGTARYSEENSQVSESFWSTRSEFGDELYDWMLYGTGRPNRVSVVDVIGGSPALEAGLQTGDIIVRYDDRPIFAIDELRDQTTEGTPGESTAVDIVREGQELRVYVPRGPLGVRLHPTTERPPPAG